MFEFNPILFYKLYNYFLQGKTSSNIPNRQISPKEDSFTNSTTNIWYAKLTYVNLLLIQNTKNFAQFTSSITTTI